MADARIAQAQAALQEGRPSGAVGLISAVLARSDVATADRRIALLLRAQAHEDLRDPKRAIADLNAALAIDERDARVYNRLGILLADAGDATGAILALSRAVEVDPAHGRAWNNLGNALRSAGRIAESLSALQRAVAVQPDNVLAWINLGIVARDLGDDRAAETSLRQALALVPDHRTALLALAAMMRALGRIDDAIAHYSHAARLGPPDPAVYLPLAGVLAERDDLALARGAYGALLAAQPRSLRAAMGAVLTLPMVPADATSVAAVRAGFAEGLGKLERDLEAIVRGRSFADVLDDLRWTNFLLAYQGEDDRELQARFAGLAGRAIELVAPAWRVTTRHVTSRPRIRVGFASAFFLDGTVGRYFRSWITDLDRARFEVYVYHLRRELTPFVRQLAADVERVRTFTGGALVPSAIAPAIRDDALDVLVYPELGMDATSFALAALRLAPLQCAGWGHPVTTGHATIDVFFSCAAMEPEDADSHYVERLVKLPGIATRYVRPLAPSDAARNRFGLPDDAVLLLCPQSMFKIHPDNDSLFARILAAVPKARLVLFECRHPALTARYRARLDAALARDGVLADGRVHVLAQCGHDDYLRINRVCDAMLDTLHWSGGNTSLDALACGLPIVTLPGRFMRGRQSAGMLRLMGIDELVASDADDYLRIAARLAHDTRWRDDVASRIVSRQERIFDDPAPVAQFARFLADPR